MIGSIGAVRGGLKIALVTMWALLLGLLPCDRAFTAAMRRAETYAAASEYGAAVESWRAAAGLSPASPAPWERMGAVYMRQHRFELAAGAFREAKARGGGEQVLLSLAEAQAAGGDWAAALGTWASAQALARRDARAYLGLGRAALAQGQFAPARAYLARALELRPDAATAAAAHALLGRLLLDDDPSQAERLLAEAGDADMLAVLRAVATEPDPARWPLLLGIAFVQRDELSLARWQLERAIVQRPDSAEAYAYLGHVLDRQGTSADGRRAMERAIELDPELGLAYYFLGAQYNRLGNPQQAQRVLWSGLQHDPENAALRLEMAQACVGVHDYALAEEWYRGAAEVAPADQQLDFELALVHFYVDHLYGLGNGAAVDAAKSAAALAPDDARAQDLLGWAYYLAGRPADAAPALARALALDPGLASAHFHLGSFYVTVGQDDLARTHLQRAADLDTGGFYRERAEALLLELN